MQVWQIVAFSFVAGQLILGITCRFPALAWTAGISLVIGTLAFFFAPHL